MRACAATWRERREDIPEFTQVMEEVLRVRQIGIAAARLPHSIVSLAV